MSANKYLPIHIQLPFIGTPRLASVCHCFTLKTFLCVFFIIIYDYTSTKNYIKFDLLAAAKFMKQEFFATKRHWKKTTSLKKYKLICLFLNEQLIMTIGWAAEVGYNCKRQVEPVRFSGSIAHVHKIAIEIGKEKTKSKDKIEFRNKFVWVVYLYMSTNLKCW